MIFRATDKNRFDSYFAEDLVDALTAAQKDAQRVELDDFTVSQVLAYLARRFKLEVTPPDTGAGASDADITRARAGLRTLDRRGMMGVQKTTDT